MNKVLGSLEKLIPVFIAVYMVGFAAIGPSFAKLGIPLSGAPFETAPKIFLTEIFLFLLAGVAAANIALRPRELLGKIKPTALLLLILGFLLIAFLRIALEIRQSPGLVLRSSAFAWYLVFPLLFLCNSVSARQIDRAVKTALLILFVIFCFMMIGTFWINDIYLLQRSWMPEYGMSFILFFALAYESPITWVIPLGFLGAAIGFSLSDKIQRTTIIALGFSTTIISLSSRKMQIPKRRLRRLFLLAVMIPGGVVLLSSRPMVGNVLSKFFFRLDPSPLSKAERGALGIENFRESMWLDALELVKNHPVAGIGFREQVVKRVYIGQGRYMPNNGGFENEKAPPISGPHNSYLNAAARLGIPTALLLVATLALSLAILYSRAYWPAFFCLLGQVIYAFFNVGLEGPVRSFGLLMCISAALKLAQESAQMEKNRFL